MVTMKKVLRSEKSHAKGTKAHRMERKRSETMAVKKAKSESSKTRLSTVKSALKKIRSM